MTLLTVFSQATDLIGQTQDLVGQFDFPLAYNLIATFLFGLTGVILAIKRGYDLIGVSVLAFVAGAGGGLLRDGIFLQNGPVLFIQDTRFVLAIFFAILVGLSIPSLVKKFNPVFFIADALGLGIYGVIGAQMTINLGLDVFAAIIVGFITAIGGGLLRDTMIKKEPVILLPGQYYAVAALSGVITFLILAIGLELNAQFSAIVAITFTFILRVAAVKFDMRSKPAAEFAGVETTRAIRILDGFRKKFNIKK